MYGLPPKLIYSIEWQICNHWLRGDFIAWAGGAGFMASLLGHNEIRDTLMWLVSIKTYTEEEGSWYELQ